MKISILGLGTSLPPYVFLQNEVAKKFVEVLQLDPEKAQQVRQLYQNTAIHKRHAVLNDFNQERSQWSFWGTEFPHTIPGMTERNQAFKENAPLLAHEAALRAIEDWGGDPASLTHIISISCTGVLAPGLEFLLMQSLKLSPTINRLGINFMGCFGAFKGLSAARAFAAENPSHRVLVVCTELCSLHLQTDLDSETLIGNSLFGDGASAVIVGQPKKEENKLWEIKRSHQAGIENSLKKMSWEASSRGYLMRLSHTVPVYLGRAIKAFTTALLEEGMEPPECDWPIHPGGKSILQSIEKALKLTPQHTQAAWSTLANYGNMSSATFFFVLDELRRQETRRDWAAGLAFGPGLSIEGVLLRHETV